MDSRRSTQKFPTSANFGLAVVIDSTLLLKLLRFAKETEQITEMISMQIQPLQLKSEEVVVASFFFESCIEHDEFS
ncbi:hypothetical protein L1887_18103 [Cichorium endivia]|nr:hypothetical protein L1887_18103 [Cichorium endivia]